MSANFTRFTEQEVLNQILSNPGDPLTSYIRVNLVGSSIDIGTVDQGTGGSSPWLVKFSQAGTDNNVTVSSLPAITGSVSITNFPATVDVSDRVGRLLGVIKSITDTVTIAGSVSVSNFPATQTITGSVSVSNFPATQAVTQSGTWNVGLSTGSNTIGKVDQGTGGSSAWKVDGSAVTQPVSGTFFQATQPVSLASLPALVAGSALIGKVGIDQTTPGTTDHVTVDGSVASGSVDSGNPVKVGGKVQNTNITAYTDGNRGNIALDSEGRQVVSLQGDRKLEVHNNITLTDTTETTLLAQVASTFIDLTALVIINTSATAVEVDIRDTTGGSVIVPFYLPAGETRGINLTMPIPQTTVNTNWTAKLSGSVSSVKIFAQGVKKKG